MSSEKLFDFRSADGVVNKGAIETIRMVEKKLEPFPAFVGIAVRGSVARGYSTDSSDIDIVVLYDSDLPGVIYDGSQILELSNLSASLYVETSMLPNFRVVNADIKDINPGAARDDSLPEPYKFFDIFRIVVGPKIKQYRALYADLMRQLSESDFNKIVTGLAEYLAIDDSLGWRKMAERISGVSMEDYRGEMELYDEILKANRVDGRRQYDINRRILWKARVMRLLRVESGVKCAESRLFES